MTGVRQETTGERLSRLERDMVWLKEALELIIEAVEEHRRTCPESETLGEALAHVRQLNGGVER